MVGVGRGKGEEVGDSRERWKAIRGFIRQPMVRSDEVGERYRLEGEVG